MLIVCIYQCQASWGVCVWLYRSHTDLNGLLSTSKHVGCIILSVGYPGNKKTAQESSTDRKEYGEVRGLYKKSAEVNASVVRDKKKKTRSSYILTFNQLTITISPTVNILFIRSALIQTVYSNVTGLNKQWLYKLFELCPENSLWSTKAAAWIIPDIQSVNKHEKTRRKTMRRNISFKNSTLSSGLKKHLLSKDFAFSTLCSYWINYLSKSGKK